jgi:hypothetical protein
MVTMFIIGAFTAQVCGQQRKFNLVKPYSFIKSDGEINRLEMKNDLLLRSHGSLFDIRESFNLEILNWEIVSTHKIIRSVQYNNLWLVMTEPQTDKLEIKGNHSNHFSVTAFRNLSQEKMEMLEVANNLKRSAADSILNTGVFTDNWFYYTSFSDYQWQKLSKLNPIISKEDFNKIDLLMKGKKVEKWISLYKNNPVKEMYGSGVMSEILNRICIELNYSPIGAEYALKQIKSID